VVKTRRRVFEALSGEQVFSGGGKGSPPSERSPVLKKGEKVI